MPRLSDLMGEDPRPSASEEPQSAEKLLFDLRLFKAQLTRTQP